MGRAARSRTNSLKMYHKNIATSQQALQVNFQPLQQQKHQITTNFAPCMGRASHSKTNSLKICHKNIATSQQTLQVNFPALQQQKTTKNQHKKKKLCSPDINEYPMRDQIMIFGRKLIKFHDLHAGGVKTAISQTQTKKTSRRAHGPMGPLGP